jgi:lysophospholipase L1-like esterase
MHFPKLRFCLALIGFIFGASGAIAAAETVSTPAPAPAESAPAVAPAAKPGKYAADVAKLAAAPAPAPGGVLMIGSSIFRKWTTAAQDLAPLPVTNRAFGGSRTADQLTYFDQLVPASQAALVVWYCGSNDVNAKKAPGEILQNTRAWIARTRAALPQARIVLLSVIRAPQKRESGYLSQVDEINQGLLALAAQTPDLTYLDINPALETPAGDPVPECYVADKLHLTPEGYRRVTAVVLPVLKTRWQAPSAATP